MENWLKKASIGVTVVALGGFMAACEDGADNGAENGEDNGDTVTAASITADPDEVEASLSADGNWFTGLTDDVQIDGEVTAAGEYEDEDYAKLALYDTDDEGEVTDEFTFDVDTLTVETPDLRIQGGVIDGDVYVDAEGFHIIDTTISGDVTFSSEDLEDSADLDEGTVEGEVGVDE